MEIQPPRKTPHATPFLGRASNLVSTETGLAPARENWPKVIALVLLHDALMLGLALVLGYTAVMVLTGFYETPFVTALVDAIGARLEQFSWSRKP